MPARPSIFTSVARRIFLRHCLVVFSACLACSCRRDMADQPRHKPLSESSFFPDGAASRPLPAHTVARGDLREDDHFYTGRVAGEPVTTFPEPVTLATLQRGQERYEIDCAICHGATGEGHGMVVQRGFPVPPSLHLDRLRTAPVGHFFEVISNGYGVMPSYASRVKPSDRWAIIAYLRALQLSQHASLADAEPSARTRLEAEARHE